MQYKGTLTTFQSQQIIKQELHGEKKSAPPTVHSILHAHHKVSSLAPGRVAGGNSSCIWLYIDQFPAYLSCWTPQFPCTNHALPCYPDHGCGYWEGIPWHNFLGGREGGGSIHNKNRPCKVFWIFTFTTTSPPPLSPLLNPLLIHKIYISLAFHDQNAEHSPRAVLSAACCEYVNLQNSNDCGKAIALKTTLVSSSSSMQRGWWFSVNRQTEQ